MVSLSSLLECCYFWIIFAHLDRVVIYHLAPQLDKEGHRRLIGNDIAVIFFLEEGAKGFDTTLIDELGTVPQVIIMISMLLYVVLMARFSLRCSLSCNPWLATIVWASSTDRTSSPSCPTCLRVISLSQLR